MKAKSVEKWICNYVKCNTCGHSKPHKETSLCSVKCVVGHVKCVLVKEA